MSKFHYQLVELANESYNAVTFRRNDVECIVRTIEDADGEPVMVIAWRGTEGSSLVRKKGWMDALRDLRILPWYDRRTGWTHSGFLKGARLVIERDLSQMDLVDVPIVMTGHSMGGALAQVAGVMMRAMNYDVKEVVSFGSPRIWKIPGRNKRLQLPMTLYRHGCDPVTQIPCNFRHPPQGVTQMGHTGNGISVLDHRPMAYRDAMRVAFMAAANDPDIEDDTDQTA